MLGFGLEGGLTMSDYVYRRFPAEGHSWGLGDAA